MRVGSDPGQFLGGARKRHRRGGAGQLEHAVQRGQPPLADVRVDLDLVDDLALESANILVPVSGAAGEAPRADNAFSASLELLSRGTLGRVMVWSTIDGRVEVLSNSGRLGGGSWDRRQRRVCLM